MIIIISLVGLVKKYLLIVALMLIIMQSMYIRVPYNQTIYFETNSKVWIFVATGISSNMIIPSYMLAPESNILVQEANLQRIVSLGYYLEIDLKITSTIYFDNLTHMFQIGPLPE